MQLVGGALGLGDLHGGSPDTSPEMSPVRKDLLFRPSPLERTLSAPPAPDGNNARLQERRETIASNYLSSLTRSKSLPALLK